MAVMYTFAVKKILISYVTGVFFLEPVNHLVRNRISKRAGESRPYIPLVLKAVCIAKKNLMNFRITWNLVVSDLQTRNVMHSFFFPGP
jgi:hypothetical protein